MPTPPVLLYLTSSGPVATMGDRTVRLEHSTWDDVLNAPSPFEDVRRQVESGLAVDGTVPLTLRAPIGTQEVWAAGVTYYRSRDARMDEAREAGGSSFYDRVIKEFSL